MTAKQITEIRKHLEEALVLLGRAGGNTLAGPGRLAWERTRSAIDALPFPSDQA